MAKKRPEPVVAKLSPSNSDKWLVCYGYGQAAAEALAQREPEPEDLTSPAAEGSAAHGAFQLARVLGLPAEELVGLAGYKTVMVTPEMAEAVQVALDWADEWARLNEPDWALNEKPLRITLGGRELTGTTDEVAYSSRADALLVLDYKHGSGVWVPAEGNTQVGLYLLMALETLDLPRRPRRLVGAIAQPRCTYHDGGAPVRTWEPTMRELSELRDQAHEAVLRAYEPDPPRTAGSHCKWCPAAPTCRTLAEYSLRTAMTEFEDIRQRPVISPTDPRSLSADGLAYVLQAVPVIEGWLRAVEAEALRRMLRSSPVPGFKIVAGRSMRQWSSAGKALEAAVHAGLPIDEIAPRSLVSPAAVLRTVKQKWGKKNPELAKNVAEHLNRMITKSQPLAHVAPEHDPRPALHTAAALEFTPITQEQPNAVSQDNLDF